jgi:ferritin-like metal-binding protein YciE
MATAKERLLEWLRDAHAMEEQAEQMLSSTSQRIENYPDLRAQMERHLEETRGQARRLRSCIERLGSSTSTIKDLAGKVVAFGQGLSGLFVDDEVVKGSLASYTFEHMEIASYRILIAAAQQAGDSETARICEQNLREEEAMAAWLEKNLASVTTRYLQREQTPGVTAKH